MRHRTFALVPTCVFAGGIILACWQTGGLIYIGCGIGVYFALSSSTDPGFWLALLRATAGGAAGTLTGGWIIAWTTNPLPERQLAIGWALASAIFIYGGALMGAAIGFLCCFYTRIEHCVWRHADNASRRRIDIAATAIGMTLIAVIFRVV